MVASFLCAFPLHSHLSSQDHTSILGKNKWIIPYMSYYLLFSSPFSLLILELKLKFMHILHSKHIHLWKHSVSSSPNFPVPFSALFSLSLFLFTGLFLCQHKWAVITPYNINCCSAFVLHLCYLCVEWSLCCTVIVHGSSSSNF